MRAVHGVHASGRFLGILLLGAAPGRPGGSRRAGAAVRRLGDVSPAPTSGYINVPDSAALNPTRRLHHRGLGQRSPTPPARTAAASSARTSRRPGGSASAPSAASRLCVPISRGAARCDERRRSSRAALDPRRGGLRRRAPAGTTSTASSSALRGDGPADHQQPSRCRSAATSLAPHPDRRHRRGAAVERGPHHRRRSAPTSTCRSPARSPGWWPSGRSTPPPTTSVGGHDGTLAGLGRRLPHLPGRSASCGSSTVDALCLQGRFPITTKLRTTHRPAPRPTATATWSSPAPTRASSGSSARTTGR